MRVLRPGRGRIELSISLQTYHKRLCFHRLALETQANVKETVSKEKVVRFSAFSARGLAKFDLFRICVRNYMLQSFTLTFCVHMWVIVEYVVACCIKPSLALALSLDPRQSGES